MKRQPKLKKLKPYSDKEVESKTLSQYLRSVFFVVVVEKLENRYKCICLECALSVEEVSTFIKDNFNIEKYQVKIVGKVNNSCFVYCSVRPSLVEKIKLLNGSNKKK